MVYTYTRMSSVIGGQNNCISRNSNYSSIIGGQNNSIDVSFDI
jgi:hypothetical protein